MITLLTLLACSQTPNLATVNHRRCVFGSGVESQGTRRNRVDLFFADLTVLRWGVYLVKPRVDGKFRSPPRWTYFLVRR